MKKKPTLALMLRRLAKHLEMTQKEIVEEAVKSLFGTYPLIASTL